MLGYLRQTLRQARVSLVLLIALTAVLGAAYPLAVLGVGQLMLPAQANGSLLGADGKPLRPGEPPAASALLAQAVPADETRLFFPRPSAADWDPAASAASNLGPNDPALAEAKDAARRVIAEREGVAPAEVPTDAVTSSGSGLDPHISPAYAQLQIPRVAEATGLGIDVVRRLVAEATIDGPAAFLGQPSVNTTSLNLALNLAVAERLVGG